eukprot:gene14038-16143_t
MFVALFTVALVGVVAATSSTYNTLDEILQSGVDIKTYPGAVGVVGNLDGLLYMNPVGRYGYESTDPAINMVTLFDMASVTKVVSTTSAVALLYQSGYLGLNDLVGDILGSEFNNGGKETITITNCLVHNAGFAPDPNPFWSTAAFNCPATTDPDVPEDMTCWNPMIFNSIMTQVLVTPPGQTYVYSDLSFMTLQLVVGTVVLNNNLVTSDDMSDCMNIAVKGSDSPLRADSTGITADQSHEVICAFEAFLRVEMFQRPANSVMDTTASVPWLINTGYRPAQSLWSYAAPTVNDTGPGSYAHKRYQGQVSDGNAYAMGGIAGHAGLFSTIADMAKFGQYMLARSIDDSPVKAMSELNKPGVPTMASKASGSLLPFLNSTTVKLFGTVHNITQSSRALGWTTNTPQISDYGFNNSCGAMSSTTFMHIGYTGTCICIDPVNKLFSAVLTTRVYNCDVQGCPSDNSMLTKDVYRRFNTEAVKLFVV